MVPFPRAGHIKSKESKCASRPATSENRPHAYRNWTEISMREAMNAVSEQGMSVTKASRVFLVYHEQHLMITFLAKFSLVPNPESPQFCLLVRNSTLLNF